jgi:DNA segregation ATPase FtsK/SpoIIIE, S-DNA-T family
VTGYLELAGWLLVVLLGGRLVYAAVRFAMLPPAAKRNYPAALWAKFRWRWLCVNLSLAYLDRHRKRATVRTVPFGTSVKVQPPDMDAPARLRYPRARFRADAFGLVARVKTVPKVGRAEFEKNADYIADAWRCHRVQVSQPKPGRLLVRGLRTDPLTLPYPMADAPAEVYSNPHHESHLLLRLYAGRDEWGADRWLPLPGVTGITIGGLPGYGKTLLAWSWLAQLAPAPVAFAFVDGKGGGDYFDWQERAWLFAGDDLAAAAAVLEAVYAEMRSRFATVLERTGYRNAWHRGPSPDFPMVVTVIDEAHTFFDLDAVRRDQEAERLVRRCRFLAGELVRKGRSVLMLTILITQKQTSDAIPTAIRDNCRVGASFAARTRDAAVAALGEHIREYPTYCPTGLQDPAYTGVCTVSLRTGLDPFVRLRVPEVTEQAALERARGAAALDSCWLPNRVLPVPAPRQPALTLAR